MAESTPSPKRFGEIDTSKPYADVKEAISRFDHLPAAKNSAEKRVYESPVGALKEQLAAAAAARDRAEKDKSEIEAELVRVKESYEQLGRKLDGALAAPSISRDELQKLYESAMADLEASRNRIQELEASVGGGGGAATAPSLINDDDQKVDEGRTVRSLSKELEDVKDPIRPMDRAEELSREVEKLAEELRIAKMELESLKSSSSGAMAVIGKAAVESSGIEAAIKEAEEEKITLLVTKGYLEPELESTKLEKEELQRHRGGGGGGGGDGVEPGDEAAAAEKIKEKIEAARSVHSKTRENVAAVMEGYEQVAAEAVEAEVVRAGVVEEVSRMKAEMAEIKAGTSASEQRIQELCGEAKMAKESESRAMESIRNLDDDHVDEETIVEEETKKRLAEARSEEDLARSREEELRKKLEAARAEIEATRADLKQANDKASGAEAAKAAVEGELRRWRSDNEQRRRMAMVANLTAATPVPQRNGDTTVVPAQVLVSNVSSMDHGRFSSSSRDQFDLPPRSSASVVVDDHGGRRASSAAGESLAQVLQMKMPDVVAAAAAGKSMRNQDQIVVETVELKKKKLKFLARLGAIFTARRKRS